MEDDGQHYAYTELYSEGHGTRVKSTTRAVQYSQLQQTQTIYKTYYAKFENVCEIFIMLVYTCKLGYSKLCKR